MFIRLPSSHTSNSRAESSRRYPLTPSTVAPPSVSKQSSCAARRDSGCGTGDSSRARALLSRTASSPVSPKVGAVHPAPKHYPSMSENEGQRHQDQRHPAMIGALERRWSEGQEVTKYWTGHEQRDGYISFPDFEKYFQSYDDGMDVHQREAIPA